MKVKSAASSIAMLAGATSAQQTLWGQCGGINYSGQTSCVSGSYCGYINDWYYQCLPGAASKTTTSPVTTPPVSTTEGCNCDSTTTSPTSVTSTFKTSTTTSTSSGSTSTAFAKAVGTKFNIDGVTKYYAGTNSYWIGFLTNDADIDKAMDDIAASGLKILRVWGFNDVTSTPSSNTVYYQLLSSSGSTINTGANGLQRLDYVVSSAETRGIKLIINFVNNWGDYGGIDAYVSVFGGTHQTWYTNTAAQAQYQKYIAAVVSRYKSSSAVLAWELANEPRCNGCDTSVITNWASTTSAYVKSLDSNHMVTLGDEGMGLTGDGSYPYQYTEGVDFVKNLAISTLDFGTFHLYTDQWGVANDFGNSWVTTHAAACASANKPCYFEEYGSKASKCSVESAWQSTSLGLADSGMGGDSFWQFGDTLSGGNTPNDDYTIYIGTSDWTCLVTDHINNIG